MDVCIDFIQNVSFRIFEHLHPTVAVQNVEEIHFRLMNLNRICYRMNLKRMSLIGVHYAVYASCKEKQRLHQTIL